MAADTLEGHCLCGAVSLSISQPKEHVEVCHCDMCRRWGGAFHGSVVGEEVTINGEDAVSIYKSSDWAERAFCGTCGSNLWFRFLPTGTRGFAAGLFAGADKYIVEKEIFTDEQAVWGSLKGDHPRQTGEEVIAEAKAAGFTFD